MAGAIWPTVVQVGPLEAFHVAMFRERRGPMTLAVPALLGVAAAGVGTSLPCPGGETYGALERCFKFFGYAAGCRRDASVAVS